MLVLTEEAYARVVESSPNRNADEGVVPGAGVSNWLVAAPRQAVERWDSLSKLILHRSLARKSVSASG
jgi:hypothetical protein